MPELPEVETVCRGLRSHSVGKTIAAVQCNRPDIRFPLPENMAERLHNRTITAVERRAKYVLWYCAAKEGDSGEVLATHLGMTGRLLYHAVLADAAPKKHDHVCVTFADGSGIVFNDARRFGYMLLAPEHALLASSHFAVLGVEPLEAAFDGHYLHAKCKRSSSPIKLLIMNQKIVVGVGNIYASEALYRAQLHPETPANQLKQAQCSALVAAIKQVLAEAIESGGSTLRDYVRSSGDVGYFQHHFAVYGREGEPCHMCTTPIRRIVQSGRASFYCGQCQPLHVV